MRKQGRPKNQELHQIIDAVLLLKLGQSIESEKKYYMSIMAYARNNNITLVSKSQGQLIRFTRIA